MATSDQADSPALRPLLMGLLAWTPWLGALAWLGYRGTGLETAGYLLTLTAVAGVMLTLALLRALPFASRFRDPELWVLQTVAGLALMVGWLRFVEPGGHLLLMLATLPWLAWHGLRLGSLATGILAVVAASAAVLLPIVGELGRSGLMLTEADLEKGLAYLLAAGGVLIGVSAVDLARAAAGGRTRGLRRALEEANRPHLLDRDELVAVFEREKARVQRQKDVFSVCIMEVDDLNRLHLERGPETTESVCQAFGNCILARVRQLDVVGRLEESDASIGLYHGRHFIAILPGTPIPGGVSFANRIRHALAQVPLRVDGGRMHCSMSAGVAQFRRGEDFGSLLVRAESALGRAHRLGPDRVEKETAGEPAEAR